MLIVRDVSISDGNGHVLANHLHGNVEAKQLDLVADAAVGAHFKKGAYYTATDTHSTWQVAYNGAEGGYIHFLIAA